MDFLLYTVLGLSIGIAICSAIAIYDALQYDRWLAEFSSKDIHWPTEDVTDVAYREVPRRSTNRS